MHIILTHEQSDFDALASLLGAHMLAESHIPVLPRRINRNVRAFLTLYGAELPFVDPRDLPSEPVEMVTLVDTQSMVSVRGMSDATRVHLIDHHPLREDLPDNWTITVSGTGANTTVFVEMIRAREIALTTVQATLLLLGIYEDTGSLTYDRTTPRDLRAAGSLLEQGASLQVAANFLNHPLSTAQQSLYDHLRQTAEYCQIHGYTIIIAQGEAEEMLEELSSIAHKLRDLLDPDALILIVTTRGGVQLIARSTTDNIDVAALASHFGGGGHERAAASLIKDGSLQEVYEELKGVLPGHVSPAVTVAQIMSPEPHLLAPDTPVQEASRRMQRYGYEGYPVVHGSKVVGLLTRRAVDRARTHRLDVTAASLMDAGAHAVGPDDSIEHLQRLMTDTGWGQIPVIDPQSGKIVGIVTRTDLLKTLVPRQRIPGRQNLSERLQSALPQERIEILKSVAEAAREKNVAVYIVGGFVRDLLLDRPSLDFDLVVEGDAIALARALAHRYGGRVTSHARFGTAKWFMDAAIESLDFITARTEFYLHPSALPTVERSSIKLDLHRRDFTINTLALRLDGRHYGDLYDYWGGLADLRQGVVRVLHSLSFVDDPTRILRAIRFEQRFGFQIEKRTLDLIAEATPLLDKVSGDRIRHEMDHILVEEHVQEMLARLDDLGLLKAIHPALIWDEWFHRRIDLARASSPEPQWGLTRQFERSKQKRDLIYILWFMRLPANQVREVVSRLKLAASLTRNIQFARRLWKDLPKLQGLPASGVFERLIEVPMIALFALYLGSEEDAQRATLRKFATQWRKVRPNLSGHDLRAKGLPPGPVYKEILKALRAAWLDGEIDSKEQEEEYLDELLKRLN